MTLYVTMIFNIKLFKTSEKNYLPLLDEVKNFLEFYFILKYILISIKFTQRVLL